MRFQWPATLGLALLLVHGVSSGHCDSLDGPVVSAARVALDSGNIEHVLIWVQEQHEAEVAEAFRRALDVRALSPSARDLADRYFFETLVRLHRAGEGAPYTGLKPVGTDFGPAVSAADASLESGSVEGVLALLDDVVRLGVEEHFDEAVTRRGFDPKDLVAGRQYVRAYVEYMHYVERIFDAAITEPEGHFPEHE